MTFAVALLTGSSSRTALKTQPSTHADAADQEEAQDANGKPEDMAADPKNKTKIPKITKSNFHNFGIFKNVL